MYGILIIEKSINEVNYMNILTITDGFTKGGLETHINTYYNALKDDNNLIFCFGYYAEYGYLQNAKIITGFHFSSSATIKEFCSDVNKLIKIINDNDIDVIHVHPFYCIFPAIFAANITNTKLIYTYHGRASINFPSFLNDYPLFALAIETLIQKVFCVTDYGTPFFNDYHKNQAILFNNLVDENAYEKHNVTLNKKWALVSRLDSDKEKEILELLNIISELDIEKIDIYGDGTQEKRIIKYVKKLHLQNMIDFKGYCIDINKQLKDYTGVIGLGRVAIESLTMNYPTLIIGFGKVSGLIDKDYYNKLKYTNFVPAEFPAVNIETLKKQIININKGNYKRYQLRDIIIKDMGIHKTNEYLNIIKEITPISLKVYDNIFERIKKLKNKELLFYTSEDVFEILKEFISSYTNNPELKREIVMLSQIIELKKINTEQSNNIFSLNKELQSLKNEISQNANSVQTLSHNINEFMKNHKESLDNTSLLTLIKRDFSKFKYRIKTTFKKK